MQTAGICFRQFKYALTTKYIRPFKDDLEKLKCPPIEYSHIEQDHWDAFVSFRLREEFQVSIVVRNIQTLYSLTLKLQSIIMTFYYVILLRWSVVRTEKRGKNTCIIIECRGRGMQIFRKNW